MRKQERALAKELESLGVENGEQTVFNFAAQHPMEKFDEQEFKIDSERLLSAARKDPQALTRLSADYDRARQAFNDAAGQNSSSREAVFSQDRARIFEDLNRLAGISPTVPAAEPVAQKAPTSPALSAVSRAIENETGARPNTNIPREPEGFAPPPVDDVADTGVTVEAAAPPLQVSILTPEQLEEVVKHWELRADIADDLTTSERVERLADALVYEQVHPELFSGQTYNFAPEQMTRYTAAMEKLETTDERHQGRSQSDIDAAMALIRDRQANPDRHAGDQTWIRTQSADLPDFLQGINLKEIILGIFELLGMRDLMEPFADKLAPGYNHADSFTDMFSNIYKKALNEMNEEGYTGGTEQVEKLVLDEVQSMIDRGALVFDSPEDQARFMQEIKTSINMSYDKGFDPAIFVNRMHEVAEQLGVREGAPQAAAVTISFDVDMDNAVGKDLHDELTGRMGMMGANLDDFMDAHMAVNDGNRYEDFFQSMQSKLMNPSYAGEAGYTQAIKDTFQEFAAQGRLFDMNGIDINTMIDAWTQNGDFAASHDTARRYLTDTMASVMDNVLQPEAPAVAAAPAAPIADAGEYDDGRANEGSVEVDVATLAYFPVQTFDMSVMGDGFHNHCFTTVELDSSSIRNGAEMSMQEISAKFGGATAFDIYELSNDAGDVYCHVLAPAGSILDEQGNILDTSGQIAGQAVHINSYDYMSEFVQMPTISASFNSVGGFTLQAQAALIAPEQSFLDSEFTKVPSSLVICGSDLRAMADVSSLRVSPHGGFDIGLDVGELLRDNLEYKVSTLSNEDGIAAYMFEPEGEGEPVIVAASADVPAELRQKIEAATPDPSAQPEQSLSYTATGPSAWAGPGGMAA
jgi:hypothetical protein